MYEQTETKVPFRPSTQVCALLDSAVLKAVVHPLTRPWLESPDNTPAYVEYLAQRYNRPEFFADPNLFYQPPPMPLVQVRKKLSFIRGIEVLRLQYPSEGRPFLPEFNDQYAALTENHQVRALWYRSPVPRPTVICLHGVGAGQFQYEARMVEVDRWLKVGLDVVLLQLPYHAERRPAGAPLGSIVFPSSDFVRTNEGFRQAISDIRALIAYLGRSGVSRVGLFGYSLGAYVAALASTLIEGLEFACLVCPVVSISHFMWSLCRGTRPQREAEKKGVDETAVAEAFAVHSPLTREPLVPRSKAYFVIGSGDRIAKPEKALELWEHWGRPELHWIHGSHLAPLGRGKASESLSDWVVREGIATPPPARSSWVF